MKKSYAIKGATYRRQKGKRDWEWNSTKAFASRDLNEPERNPSTKTDVQRNNYTTTKSSISLESLGLSFNATTQRQSTITG
jgi:hypothetical protein